MKFRAKIKEYFVTYDIRIWIFRAAIPFLGLSETARKLLLRRLRLALLRNHCYFSRYIIAVLQWVWVSCELSHVKPPFWLSHGLSTTNEKDPPKKTLVT